MPGTAFNSVCRSVCVSLPLDEKKAPVSQSITLVTPSSIGPSRTGRCPVTAAVHVAETSATVHWRLFGAVVAATAAAADSLFETATAATIAAKVERKVQLESHMAGWT